MSETVKCLYCGSNCQYLRLGPLEDLESYSCDICGNYITTNLFVPDEYCEKDKTAAYLFYEGNSLLDEANKKKYNFLRTSDDKEKYTNTGYRYVTPEIIESFYPKSFNERITKIVLGLAEMLEFPGNFVELKIEELRSALFVKRYDKFGNELEESIITDQVSQIIHYLKESRYISYGFGNGQCVIRLLPEGWKRADEMQQKQTYNKNVFVAMSYAPEMVEIEEAIRDAINNCGYKPIVLKDVQHNGQIVPEMLYQIRQAKFVVAEFTNHNNGAYYEAGFAFGQGKEVIHLCKRSSFSEDGHFDVKQINTVLWDNCDDLRDKLMKRIEATID